MKKGCLERSLMYARHSLYNECEAQSRNGGLVHLTVASVYLELGGFRRCLEVRLKLSSLFMSHTLFYYLYSSKINFPNFSLSFLLLLSGSPRCTQNCYEHQRSSFGIASLCFIVRVISSIM